VTHTGVDRKRWGWLDWLMFSHDLETLINYFAKLAAHEDRPLTFMEIAGYPHNENACSNILEFFFDSKKQHGLGTLFLDALMDVGEADPTNESMGSNLSVEREVYTDNGNKIDIVIQSDTHAILIENKIFAGVQNPLLDYVEYLEHLTPQDRTKCKFLLTLYQTDEGKELGFENLSYATFVERIRSRLGHHVSRADTRYLTLLLDFLNTLENLQEGTRMNQQFVDLLAERQEDVETLLSELREFTDELRKMIQQLKTHIEVAKYDNVHQRLYRDRMSLFDDLAHDITVSEDLTVIVDTYIDPSGWYIDIWPYKSDPSKLRDLLERLEIPFEPGEEPKHFDYRDGFEFSENLDRIREVVQDLVDKIATASAEFAKP
jgi:hypothetical protein